VGRHVVVWYGGFFIIVNQKIGLMRQKFNPSLSLRRLSTAKKDEQVLFRCRSMALDPVFPLSYGSAPDHLRESRSWQLSSQHGSTKSQPRVGTKVRRPAASHGAKSRPRAAIWTSTPIKSTSPCPPSHSVTLPSWARLPTGSSWSTVLGS